MFPLINQGRSARPCRSKTMLSKSMWPETRSPFNVAQYSGVYVQHLPRSPVKSVVRIETALAEEELTSLILARSWETSISLERLWSTDAKDAGNSVNISRQCRNQLVEMYQPACTCVSQLPDSGCQRNHRPQIQFVNEEILQYQVYCLVRNA